MLYDSEKTAAAKCRGNKSEMGGDPFGTTAHFGRRSLLWKEWQALSFAEPTPLRLGGERHGVQVPVSSSNPHRAKPFPWRLLSPGSRLARRCTAGLAT